MPIPHRALPRVFVPRASSDGLIELPAEELDKLRKVLRLGSGDEIAVLPNDGTLIRCRLDGRRAAPIEVVKPMTESSVQLCIAQALPKGDKLDEIIRACSEIGVSEFIVFPSDRTVVRWDERKTADRVHRLEVIAREACEMSFRTRLPRFSVAKSLLEVLQTRREALVLSEVDGLEKTLPTRVGEACLVVGPEGGWSPTELELIGTRGVTLGPRVLRVDHAAPAAAAVMLLEYRSV